MMFCKKKSVFSSLDTGFLNYLSKKSLDYSNVFIDNHWRKETDDMSKEDSKVVIDIGKFRTLIQKELRKREIKIDNRQDD